MDPVVSAVPGEPPQLSANVVDRGTRQVLEHGDRVDAVEPFLLDVAREETADDPDAWIRRPCRLELRWSPVTAVVGIDDRDVVAEANQQVGDDRLAGSDLEQS